MAVREEPSVKLACGHWGNLGGSLRVLGETFGLIHVHCTSCDAWIPWKAPAKKKPRRTSKNDTPLF